MSRAPLRALVLLAAACAGCASRAAQTTSARAALPRPSRPLTRAEALPPMPPPVAAAALAPSVLPSVHTTVLASGLTILCVERPGDVVTTVVLAARGGHAGEPGTPLAVDVVLAMALERGLARGSGDEAREDELAGAGVDDRGLGVTLRVAPASTMRAVDHAAGLALGDGLSDEAIAVASAQAMASARRSSSTLGHVADVDLWAQFYGPSDPRATFERLETQALFAVTPALVRERFAALTVPSETAIIVVGDVHHTEIEARLAERLSGLTARAVRTVPRLPPPRFSAQPPQLHAIGSSVAQAHLRVLVPGPPRHDASHAAFRVLMRLVGGMFGARINMQMRESRGDTYGVHAALEERVDHAIIDLSMTLPVEGAQQGIDTLESEMRRLRDAARITEAELEQARAVELATQRGRFDSSIGTASALARAFLDRLELSTIAALEAQVRTVSREDVAAVARTWMVPEAVPIQLIAHGPWLQTHVVRAPGGAGLLR